MSVDVTVIILTFNEGPNLQQALDSVKGWAREVFVVDSFSADDTVDIALSRADDSVQVVQHEFENYAKQWNWALSHLPIKGEWTLKLDADEYVPPEFKSEVNTCIQNNAADLNGIYFRHRLFFLNSPLSYGGFSSTYILRLWRTGKAVFEKRPVNEHALVSGQTTKISSCIDHKNHKSISDWVDKHNRYSDLEAQSFLAGNTTGEIAPRLWGRPEERRMWLRKMYYLIPGRTIFYFFYRYILRLGFLDGKAGLSYCILHSTYRQWIEMKIKEHQAGYSDLKTTWPVRGQPHPKVKDSSLQKLVDSN